MAVPAFVPVAAQHPFRHQALPTAPLASQLACPQKLPVLPHPLHRHCLQHHVYAQKDARLFMTLVLTGVQVKWTLPKHQHLVVVKQHLHSTMGSLEIAS